MLSVAPALANIAGVVAAAESVTVEAVVSEPAFSPEEQAIALVIPVQVVAVAWA